jgi:inosine-uridine nucleoside N-ribohydrolase
VQKIPVPIDTDVDIDDWMAILYLLNHPRVEVKGLTITRGGCSRPRASGIGISGTSK